jgi:hypothetical protein
MAGGQWRILLSPRALLEGEGGEGGRSRPGEKLPGAHGLIEALTEPWTKEFYRTAYPRGLS